MLGRQFSMVPDNEGYRGPYLRKRWKVIAPNGVTLGLITLNEQYICSRPSGRIWCSTATPGSFVWSGQYGTEESPTHQSHDTGSDALLRFIAMYDTECWARGYHEYHCP